MAVCGIPASLLALHLAACVHACLGPRMHTHTYVQRNSAPCDVLGVGVLWLPDAQPVVLSPSGLEKPVGVTSPHGPSRMQGGGHPSLSRRQQEGPFSLPRPLPSLPPPPPTS